jgi:hypothetical protein
MGYDGKYGHVTTELGDIAEDEPVIVFRAQDATLPKLLAYYLMVCTKAGSPRRHLEIILDTVERVRAWQADHFTKVPESTGPAGLSYEQRHPRP